MTGLDLVAWQIRIARGEPLTIDAGRALEPQGHAIECRIYAEDPDSRFMPSPGRIEYLHAPAGPGVRRDSGVQAGFDVPISYDSLISKLSTWGEDRVQATARMLRALSEYEVRGIKTTIPFFQWMLATPDFRDARFDTTYLDALLKRRTTPFVEAPEAAEEIATVAVALRAFLSASATDGAARPARGASPWQLAARREGVRS